MQSSWILCPDGQLQLMKDGSPWIQSYRLPTLLPQSLGVFHVVSSSPIRIASHLPIAISGSSTSPFPSHFSIRHLHSLGFPPWKPPVHTLPDVSFWGIQIKAFIHVKHNLVMLKLHIPNYPIDSLHLNNQFL